MTSGPRTNGSQHASRLYSAPEVSNNLNVATDVDGDASISAGFSSPFLLRVFANAAAGEHVLLYEQHFGRQKNRNVLYLRQTGRKGQPVLSLGRFSLFEVAQFADVVRWNVGMDEEIRSGLVSFLVESSKPKTSKRKKPSTSVSPNNYSDGGDKREESRRLPLVATHPALSGPSDLDRDSNPPPP